MMKPLISKQFTSLALLGLMVSASTNIALAESTLSGGVWGTYQYLPDDKANTNTNGEFTGEALIIYADGKAEAGGKWLYSAEARFGPGSFTDPDNNSTGDQFTLHKAWVGWQLNEQHSVRVGKSQVPFGWKTVNFWPGDILLAGFGDQMDVGFKLSGTQTRWHYDLAYYVADDWGGTSTDTVDDNGHWGSSTTFRKVQTLVGNLAWNINPDNRVGVSVQSGQLQDLTGTPDKPTSGAHEAYVIYLEGEHEQWFYKASYIQQQRSLPDAYQLMAGLPEDIENTRIAAEIGYNRGDWAFYLDASMAQPDTQGNDADDVTAFAPGARYDYGPGWLYIEYLTQDGFVDRDGQVGEGDFDALYISLDFYF
ncbi:porin [Cellvibrio sp. PSBB006]|uniref:porin n=1 Tax=Cellvibrio sp. PSBB006 TaxID=1987723 RepID=UPI001E5E2D9C|nr:porin [Cellvibrio sp. PSBB006]